MSSRKLSKVSAEDYTEAKAKLGRVFAACCNRGTGVTSVGLQKFASDYHLISSNLKASDVDLIFQRVRVGKKVELNNDRFQVV